MFINFFMELRAAKVPVSLREYLTLASGGVVPPLHPRHRSNGSEPFVAPPKSIAFLRFAHVPAACAEVV